MESYALYLDTIEDPRWPAPFGKGRAKWYILTGIALSIENDLKIKLGSREISENMFRINQLH